MMKVAVSHTAQGKSLRDLNGKEVRQADIREKHFQQRKLQGQEPRDIITDGRDAEHHEN